MRWPGSSSGLLGITFRFHIPEGMRSRRETAVKYSHILFLKTRHLVWWVVREKDRVDRRNRDTGSLAGRFSAQTPSAQQQCRARLGGSPRLRPPGLLRGSPRRSEQGLHSRHNRGPAPPPHPTRPTKITAQHEWWTQGPDPDPLQWNALRAGAGVAPCLGSSAQHTFGTGRQVLRGAGPPQLSLKVGCEDARRVQAPGPEWAPPSPLPGSTAMPTAERPPRAVRFHSSCPRRHNPAPNSGASTSGQ